MLIATGRVLTELALLVGSFVIGIALADGWLSWMLGIAFVVVVASVWGLWIAPRARDRMEDPGRLILEFVLFAAVGIAVAVSASVLWGAVLLVAGVVFSVLARRATVAM